MENPIKMDDLGVSLFKETPISPTNQHFRVGDMQAEIEPVEPTGDMSGKPKECDGRKHHWDSHVKIESVYTTVGVYILCVYIHMFYILHM